MQVRIFKKISILLIIFSLSFDKVCLAALIEDNQSQTKTTPKQPTLENKQQKSKLIRRQRFKQKQKEKGELFLKQAEERKKIASQHRKKLRELLHQKKLARKQNREEKERALQEQFLLKQEQKKRVRGQKKLRLQQTKQEKKQIVQDVKPTPQQQPPLPQVEELKISVAPIQQQPVLQPIEVEKTSPQVPVFASIEQSDLQTKEEVKVLPQPQLVSPQKREMDSSISTNNVSKTHVVSTLFSKEEPSIDRDNFIPVKPDNIRSKDEESASRKQEIVLAVEREETVVPPQTIESKSERLSEKARPIEEKVLPTEHEPFQETPRQQQQNQGDRLTQGQEDLRIAQEKIRKDEELAHQKKLDEDRIAEELRRKKEEEEKETTRLKLAQEVREEQKRKDEELARQKKIDEERIAEELRRKKEEEEKETNLRKLAQDAFEKQKREEEETAHLKKIEEDRSAEELRVKKEKEEKDSIETKNKGLQHLEETREKFKQLEVSVRKQPFSKKANPHIKNRQEKENAISHKLRELYLFLDKEEKKIQDAKLGEKTGDAIAQFKTNERSFYASAVNYFAWLNGAAAQEAKHLQIGKSDANNGMEEIFLGWLNSANPQVINLLQNLSTKYLDENKNPASKDFRRTCLEIEIKKFAQDANYRWEKSPLSEEEGKKLLDDKDKLNINNQEFKKRFFDAEGTAKKKDVLKCIKKSSSPLSLNGYIFYDDSDPKSSREVYRVVLLGDSNYTATLLLDPIQNKKPLK